MPEMGTMQQINSEPLHMGTMHQLNPEPLRMGTILTPQSQAEQYAREAQQAAAEAAQSATDAQTAAESAQQAAAGAVKYSEAQTLTAAQQAQARANIGAVDTAALAAKQDAPAIAGTEGQVLTIDDRGNPVWATPTDAVSRQEFDALAEDVDWKAPAIIASAGPADIVSITDGAEDAPVKSLAVGIEPVQDLHGYDSPWPAGGGVNLLDLSSATGNTVYGFTVTKNDNTGVVTIAGAYSGTTANSSFVFLLNVPYISDTKVIAFDMNASLQEHILYQYAPVRWGNTTYGNLAIDLKGLEQGATYNFTLKPLVCSNSVTPTAWTPYSNICPISGWTVADVTRTGKNLLDPESRENLTNNVRFYFGTEGLLLKANTTYTFSVSSAS